MRGRRYVARHASGVPKTHSNRAPAPAPDVSDQTLLRRRTKTVPFASAPSGLELARGHAGSWPHWMRWSVQAQHEINLRGLPREQLGLRAYPGAERPCVGRRPSGARESRRGVERGSAAASPVIPAAPWVPCLRVDLTRVTMDAYLRTGVLLLDMPGPRAARAGAPGIYLVLRVN